jgi:hypothetical protein
MTEITVHKKGYTRKGYTRKDGTKVKSVRVPASTFKIESRSHTPKADRWAVFNKVTGWKKTQPFDTRYLKALSATNKSMSLHKRYVQAGRRLNELANVTTDAQTKKKARADAKYFFKKAEQTP